MNEMLLRKHSLGRRLGQVLGAFLILIAAPPFAGGAEPSAATFDVLIKGGTLYNGTGEKPHVVDVAIRGDRIAGLGDFPADRARTVIDAKGMAVAPGFINMLSWSTESLIEDGRSQSEIREGVTTEIMGEGSSMGPVNDRIKERMRREQGDIRYEIKWNTLAEYLRYLEQRGVSCNVASFIGATTIREHVIGLEDKQPTPERPPGNGSGRARDRHVAHLSARVLCQDGGAD